MDPRPGRPPVPRPNRTGALVGLLTAAVTLGVAHLAAALTDPVGDPVLAVGATAIDLAPQPVKAFAIRTFGTADKIVLLGGVLAVLVLVAVVLGIAAIRRTGAGLTGLVGLGAVLVAAVLARPAATVADAVPALVGVAAGAGALLALLRDARPGPAVASGRPHLLNRRQFLTTAAAATLTAVAATTGGQAVGGRRAAGTRSRSAVRIPPPATPAPPLPPDVAVEGGPAFVTANRDFYRVDTALTVPQIDVDTWRLRLAGAVERPRTWSFADLLARDLVERDITLNCVSNEVGGPYVGTARWTGVPLAPLLREAGLRPGQDQLLSRSVDGMTIGTPLTAILDGRDAMLVVAMNSEPLPVEHGFPVRMLVPGLYGYVGACKWLTELRVTTFDEVDPYWVRRGWAADAPVKTASRIDTPKPFARRPAGPLMIAGVAWAQRRGISAVEVQVDDGRWQPARLGAGPSADLWRQWTYRWDARPGSHTVRVRAVDGIGAMQTEARATPFPDGATGWHSVTVTVT
ncbi:MULTISPECIES: molybdopterin-dependent oxidoreductase [unclassified Micromonospora]|uniref:molybdopterin-dependent oxidoreductase n=1 Tax=unclassified Micromonospora TaxID=2617518 RepID=UPI0033B93AB0